MLILGNLFNKGKDKKKHLLLFVSEKSKYLFTGPNASTGSKAGSVSSIKWVFESAWQFPKAYNLSLEHFILNCGVHHQVSYETHFGKAVNNSDYLNYVAIRRNCSKMIILRKFSKVHVIRNTVIFLLRTKFYFFGRALCFPLLVERYYYITTAEIDHHFQQNFWLFINENFNEFLFVYDMIIEHYRTKLGHAREN